MGTMKTIDCYFKRKVVVDEQEIDNANQENKRHKAPKHENQQDYGTCEAPSSNTNTYEVDFNNLERDPAKRKPMWSYPVSLRKEVRRAYLNLGPFQVHLKQYPVKSSRNNSRRFKHSWFGIFPSWLEYSPTTDASYCLLCYVFNDKSNVSSGHDAFTVKGFDNWKKVNDGKNCAYLKHMSSSQHRNAVAFGENLLKQTTHIENITTKQSAEQILKNRIQKIDSQSVKTSCE